MRTRCSGNQAVQDLRTYRRMFQVEDEPVDTSGGERLHDCHARDRDDRAESCLAGRQLSLESIRQRGQRHRLPPGEWLVGRLTLALGGD